jgi:WD40 repeat protein
VESRIGERTPLTPAQTGAFEAAWTRDGRVLAVGGQTGVVLYDVAGAKMVTTLPHDGWVRDIAITPDDERVVSLTYMSDPRRLYVWSLDTHEELRTIDLPHSSMCLALLPGGRVVATGSGGDPEDEEIGPRIHFD